MHFPDHKSSKGGNCWWLGTPWPQPLAPGEPSLRKSLLINQDATVIAKEVES